jgi:hypothetical protein
LVDRSISAANAIGKTADTIGVGAQALQELRFAAKASGVEQQTLDMALQRFTRRAAEAARHRRNARERELGYTVGSLDKEAGLNNQRLYLNGTRAAQMSDTLPIDLNSAPLASAACERHRRSLQRPYPRIPRIPAVRRLDRDHLEQHERP